MTAHQTPDLVVRDAQPTAVVQTHARMDQLVEFYDHAYSEVGRVLAANGARPLQAFGRYGAMVDGEVDVEAGFTVQDPIEGDGDVVASELPAGRYAFLTHVGGYDTLRETWERLGGWMAEHGHKSGQTVFEVYVDDPTTTEPSALRTELYWSVEG